MEENRRRHLFTHFLPDLVNGYIQDPIEYILDYYVKKLFDEQRTVIHRSREKDRKDSNIKPKGNYVPHVTKETKYIDLKNQIQQGVSNIKDKFKDNLKADCDEFLLILKGIFETLYMDKSDVTCSNRCLEVKSHLLGFLSKANTIEWNSEHKGYIKYDSYDSYDRFVKFLTSIILELIYATDLHMIKNYYTRCVCCGKLVGKCGPRSYCSAGCQRKSASRRQRLRKKQKEGGTK